MTDKIKGTQLQIENETAGFAKPMLADALLRNPYKDLRCNYVYDYCNPETCNCSKAAKWNRENDPLHEWNTFAMFKPPIGEEVLAYSPEWIHPDFNPKGIRVGFLNEDENGEFISAKWWDYQDTYVNDDKTKPVKWKRIQGFR